MKQIKHLLQLAKAKNTKTGRRLAKVGLSIGGVGFGLEFSETQMIEFIPEEHRVYVVLTMHILQFLGVALFGAGVLSTEQNADELLGQKDEK